MAAEDTFGQLGRFLILAFMLPGAALSAFGYWLMPEVASGLFATVPSGLGDGTTALLILGGFTLFALVSTSIPFAIEYTVIHPLKLLPPIDFGKLAKLQKDEEHVSQLTQQIGQGIMHYNIALGGLLLGVACYVRSLFGVSQFGWAKALVVLVVFAANYFSAWMFYRWSQPLLPIDPQPKN